MSFWHLGVAAQKLPSRLAYATPPVDSSILVCDSHSVSGAGDSGDDALAGAGRRAGNEFFANLLAFPRRHRTTRGLELHRAECPGPRIHFRIVIPASFFYSHRNLPGDLVVSTLSLVGSRSPRRTVHAYSADPPR